MPEKTKKKKKLLIQVGIVTILIFVGSLLFVLSSVYSITRNAYLSSKDEMIDRDLFNIYKEMNNNAVRNQWFLDYLKKHSEAMTRDITEEEEAAKSSQAYKDALVDYFFDDTFDADKYDPVIQLLLARNSYEILMSALTLKRGLTSSAIRLMDFPNEHEALIYMEDNPNGSDHVAELVPYEASEHSAVETILSGELGEDNSIYEVYEDPSDGEKYYIGYLPINCGNNVRCTICIQYDWTDYHSWLLRNVREAVDEFVREAERFDDLTMLCVEYH